MEPETKAETTIATGADHVIDAIRASGEFDLTHLLLNLTFDSDNPQAQDAARTRLLRLNGRKLASLSQQEHAIATAALKVVLGLQELPEIMGAGESSADGPPDALKRLDRLRLGQPDPRMMMLLSDGAQRAVDYLHDRFHHRLPVVRMIAGEMGEGKTTLAREIVASSKEAGASPMMFNVPRDTVFDLSVWLRAMLLNTGLMMDAIHNIAQNALLLGDNHQQTLVDCFSNTALSAVMGTVIGQAVTNSELFSEPAAARTLAKECCGALAPWMSSEYSAVTPARDFLMRYSEGIDFSERYRREQIPTLLNDFLAFYREAGIYPVWLFDEFESISQLTSKKADVALGFFRDILDSVVSADSGALLLFSTGDGVACLRSYPALEDRLQSADDWTLASPTWYIGDFCTWHASTLFKALIALYRRGAQSGDLTAKAVIEHQEMLGEFFEEATVQEWLQDVTVVPRERLKALVALFDSAVNGRGTLGKRMAAFKEPASLLDSPLDHDSARARDPLPGSPFENTSVPHSLASDAELNDLLDKWDMSEPFPQNAAPLPHLDDDLRPLEPDHAEEEWVEWENLAAGDAPVDAGVDATTDDAKEDHIGSGGNPFQVDGADDLRTRSMLTEYGYQRWVKRLKLNAAVMPFQHNSASQAPAKASDQKKRIHSATTYARLGLRLSQFRDSGGLITKLWETFDSDTLALTKRESIALLGNTHNDLLEMERLGREFIELAAAHKNVLPVATPETHAEADNRKVLEKNDHMAIREARERGETLWPFVNDKTKWSECRTGNEITPFSNIRVFRQALYTWFAMHGSIPSDEWVDQHVLDTLRENYGYSPRTSRAGVHFLMARRGLLSRSDKRRSLAVEQVWHAV